MEKSSLKDLNIFKIPCEDFNHKDETVEYILLSKNVNFKTRLLCRKCIETNFNQHTNEVGLIANILQDPFNVFKYTNFQGNVNQVLCDFIYSYNFKFDQQAITSKIDEIRKYFLYYLSQLERKLIENYQQFSTIEDNFLNLKSRFNQYFNTDNLIQSLNEAGNKCESLTPKDKQKLRMDVNQYVQNLHSCSYQDDPEQYKILLKAIEETKNRLNEKDSQLRLFQVRLDQGLEKILKEVQNMEQTFSKLKFRASELSTKYLDQLIERINPNFKKPTNFQDKIKRIYQSKYDGLNSKIICDKIITLEKLDMQNLLFIFKTSSLQTFGVWVNQNSSILFHQDKQQEFQIKAGVKPFIMNYESGKSGRLMTFGNDDIIIQSEFLCCISKLGQGFQVNPSYQIGDLQTYLANQQYFDIVEMEIFQIQN